MRTAHYRAIPPVGVVSAPLPHEIGRQRSISTIVGHCRAVTVDFDHQRPISDDIRRGRRRGRRENLESNVALPIPICRPRAISSPTQSVACGPSPA
ncbi:hypothetical protein GW17_00022722 [Ensete ventricosum]|nr:hypothetical protein GW17_00022722 [Ensete ventricosum]